LVTRIMSTPHRAWDAVERVIGDMGSRSGGQKRKWGQGIWASKRTAGEDRMVGWRWGEVCQWGKIRRQLKGAGEAREEDIACCMARTRSRASYSGLASTEPAQRKREESGMAPKTTSSWKAEK
jgi:hypothetical protein